MNKLKQGIYNAMMERGIIADGYKISIVSKDIIGNSDNARILVGITEKGKRKERLYWNLYVNYVRGLIIWDRSNFYYI